MAALEVQLPKIGVVLRPSAGIRRLLRREAVPDLGDGVLTSHPHRDERTGMPPTLRCHNPWPPDAHVRQTRVGGLAHRLGLVLVEVAAAKAVGGSSIIDHDWGAEAWRRDSEREERWRRELVWIWTARERDYIAAQNGAI